MANAPNFIIAGAAKSGTTTLWRWLSAHPGVFMPAVKEPSFFAFEGRDPRPRGGLYDPAYLATITTEWSEYTALFRPASDHICGEASPVYMIDPKAPARIAARLPHARIILILRDPVARAYSQFMHHLRDGLEPEGDFSIALQLEGERLAQGWWWGFGYRSGGFYSHQIARFMESFPAEQLLILTSDDLAARPERVYHHLCEFIGIQPEPNLGLNERANMASGLPVVPRWGRIEHMLRHPSRIARVGKSFVPSPIRSLLRRGIDQVNVKHRPKLAPEVARQLASDYSPEIARVEQIIGRNLDAWHHALARQLQPGAGMAA